MTIIRSKQVAPHQSLREMTEPHTDIDGRTWPKGTRYEPSHAGQNNIRGWYEQVVRVAPSYQKAVFVPNERG